MIFMKDLRDATSAAEILLFEIQSKCRRAPRYSVSSFIRARDYAAGLTCSSRLIGASAADGTVTA
jgi:hypothetical protein